MRIAVPLSLTAQAARPRAGRLVRLSGPTMGVTWTLLASVPPELSESQLRAAVQGAADAVVAQMSTWEPDSDISRFNAAPAGAWLDIPGHMAAVLDAALKLAHLSDGAFDPTVGQAVDLWGFGPTGAAVAPPDPGALACAAVGWRGLERDGDRLRQPGGLKLDLSGIAKGYGVDLAAGALDALGLRDYLLDIGGELKGSGVKPSGEPWWVDFEREPGAPLADPPIRVALHGLSVATSGDWRRSFTAGGKRYSHTIDPATRAPVSGKLTQVSVLHECCMWADGYCTALAVLGASAMEVAARHDVAACLTWRTQNGLREDVSPALAKMLED